MNVTKGITMVKLALVIISSVTLFIVLVEITHADSRCSREYTCNCYVHWQDGNITKVNMGYATLYGYLKTTNWWKGTKKCVYSVHLRKDAAQQCFSRYASQCARDNEGMMSVTGDGTYGPYKTKRYQMSARHLGAYECRCEFGPFEGQCRWTDFICY